MRQLYYSLLSLIIWLSLLFNLEGLVSTFRLTPFLYAFIPACAVIIILVLRLHKVPLPWLLGAGLAAYAALALLYGAANSSESLSSIITGLSAVVVTILLSSLVGRRLAELRAAIVSMVVGHGGGEESFWHAQGMLYREVRRARRHHHPLAVLALAVPKLPPNVVLEAAPGQPFSPRVIKDMQRELIHKYVLARAARLLRQHLPDTAIVTLRDDYFVVLLPETSGEEVPFVCHLLQSTAQEQLGLTFTIGAATFPDQAITFEGLLEQAESAMATMPAGYAAPAPVAVPAAVPPATDSGSYARELAPSDASNLTTSP